MTTLLQITLDDDGKIDCQANPDIVLTESLMDQLVRYLKANTQQAKESTADFLARQIAEFSKLNREHRVDMNGRQNGDAPDERIPNMALRRALYFLHRAMLAVDPQIRRRTIPYEGPNPQLANALTLWRRKKAKETGLPAYFILHQRVLYGIADHAPINKEQLLAVNGFGPGFFARYGNEILDLVIRTLEESQAEA